MAMDIKEMYKAMPNSPILYLSANISQTATQFTVSDTSSLPDAPNLVTFISENDGEAETILYMEKTSNMLKGVQRGLQGAAKAWAAGTPMTRIHTAYDHDTFIHNAGELVKGVQENSTQLGEIPNYNYLINPDFRINQRGKPIYTETGYAFDRWYFGVYSGFATLEKIADGIKITTSANKHIVFVQPIENPAALFAGKKITFSALFKGAVAMGVWGDTAWLGRVQLTNSDFALQSITVDVPDTITSLSVSFENLGTNADEVIIKYAKLEIGDRATPNEPRFGFVEERLCKRYHQIVRIDMLAPVLPLGYARYRNVVLKTEFVPMRVNPFLVKAHGVFSDADGTAHIVGIGDISFSRSKSWFDGDKNGITNALLMTEDGAQLADYHVIAYLILDAEM